MPEEATHAQKTEELADVVGAGAGDAAADSAEADDTVAADATGADAVAEQAEERTAAGTDPGDGSAEDAGANAEAADSPATRADAKAAEDTTEPHNATGPHGAREAAGAGQGGDSETVVCPLCASTVSAQALTCPRCKSRLDAEPRYETPLSQAFTANGTFKKEAFVPGQNDPSDTAPMPALQMGVPASASFDVLRTAGSAQGFVVRTETPPAPHEGPGNALGQPQTSASSEGSHTEQIAAMGAPSKTERIAVSNAPSTTEQIAVPGAPAAGEDAEPSEGGGTESFAPANPQQAAAGSRFEVLEPRRRGKKIAVGVAAALVLVAFALGVGILGAQANTLNQITEERVEADIRADGQFATGSAANDFVEELPYAIESVLVGERSAVDGGIEAPATVTMSNGYFSETRKVLVRYEPANAKGAGADGASAAGAAAASSAADGSAAGAAADSAAANGSVAGGATTDDAAADGSVAGGPAGATGAADASQTDAPQAGSASDGWIATCTIEEHAVKPTRGIYQDPDYGFVDAQTEFDAAAGVCRATVPREGAVDGKWFLNNSGYETVEYTFTNDAWQRTGVDTSTVQTDYQNLVGTYADGQAGSPGRAHFAYFAITSVDDATGAFEGTYRWVGAEGFFGDSETIAGNVSGTIGLDGTIGATSSRQPGSLELAGSAQGDQTLAVDATVYGEPSFFSLSGAASESTLSASLVKQTSEILPDTYEAPATSGRNANSGNREAGSRQSQGGADDEDDHEESDDGRSTDESENDSGTGQDGGWSFDLFGEDETGSNTNGRDADRNSNEAPSSGADGWFDSWFGYGASSNANSALRPDAVGGSSSSAGAGSGSSAGAGTSSSAGATSSNRR